jgi:hypothetical protein
MINNPCFALLRLASTSLCSASSHDEIGMRNFGEASIKTRGGYMKVKRLVGEYFIYNNPTTKPCNIKALGLFIDDIV